MEIYIKSYNKGIFLFIILLSLGVVSTTLSCSGADPVIYQLRTQLQVYWKYPYQHYERLLVQILADDEDGFDEIYEVYIIHDESELYWRSTKDEWSIKTVDDNEWIVLSNVSTIDRSNLPRGKYRIVLLDFSGYRDERIVYLKQEDRVYDRNSLPLLQFQSQGLYIPYVGGAMEEDFDTRPLMLELAYPTIKTDFAGNLNTYEHSISLSFLGEDGIFYAVKRDLPVKLVLKENARANLYIHFFGVDDVLYTTGPFEVTFEK